MTMTMPMPQRLLQSKLNPPIGGRALVARPRLLQWLQSAEHAKLAILRAPAGFGKTTLMVQWLLHLRELGVPTAWLTLDEADNDLIRFLTYLSAALGKCVPDFEPSGLASGVLGPGQNPTGVLMYLIDRISISEAPFTLFLDDFGAIKTPGALKLVRQLLLHLPPGKRIVIAIRHLPELNLGRLRAQGDLVEIDLEGLRFSLEETAQFIRQMQNEEFDETELASLHRSTEGWAAGIQLSTLSSIWRDKKGLSGSNFPAAFDNISSYLAEDVLAGQPAEIQAFMLQTSILDRLSGPLCDALTGRSDGEDVLDYLEKQNLFLVPFDEERRWYRYHSLFSKFLRHQLERKGGECQRTLHQAACDWYAGAGETLEAAMHAMLAGDPEKAAALVEPSALHLAKNGQIATVAEWAERLPADVLDRYPALQLCYTHSQIFSVRYEKAHAILDRLADNVRLLRNDTFSQDIRIARAFILMSQENFPEFEKTITEGLAAYDPAKRDTDTRFLPIIMNMAGMLQLTLGKLEQALNTIWEGARLIGVPKDDFKVYNKYYEGRIYLAKGNLREALLLTRCILGDDAYGPCRYSAGGTAVAMLEAETLYEKNDLVGAGKLLAAYSKLLPTVLASEAVIVGFRTRARICLAGGDVDGALQQLAELERLGVQRGIPRASASARQERIRVALLQGDPEQADRICRDHDDDLIWARYEGYCMLGNDPETPEITRLRLLIGRGNAREALEPLKRGLREAEAKGYFRQGLLLRILLAKAYDGCQEPRRAIEFLQEALHLAQKEGFLRCFLDEGEPVLRLLREVYKGVMAEENMGGGGIAAGYLEQIRVAAGVAAPPPRPSCIKTEPDFPMVEPLTDREQDILEKLAMGLSSQELADSLFISVNTIRYHLRNIYAKTGTNNRVQTVAYARRVGLIR